MLIKFLRSVFNQTDNGHFETTLEQFEQNCFSLKTNFSYVWLLDICFFEKQSNELIYQFYDGEYKIGFSIKVKFGKSLVPSLAHLWKISGVYEQEVFENYGVLFSRTYGHLYQGTNKYEGISFSEKHSYMASSSKFYCKLNECNVKSVKVESGLFHIGLEKSLKNKSYSELKQTLEFYFSQNASLYAVNLCRMLEEQRGINIPDRAKALRMVVLEFNRIYSHITSLLKFVTELELDMGREFFSLYLKKIQSLFVSLSGNEYSRFYVVTGGVLKDVGQDWVSRAVTDLHSLERSLLKLRSNLLGSEYNKNILLINALNKKSAFEWNMTGLISRASGVNFDLRKSNPFYFYKDVDFQVPVGVKGSLWELIDLRIEEIFQSIKIISQVLDNLPTGEHLIKEFLPVFSEKNFDNQIDKKSYHISAEEAFSVETLNKSILFEGASGIYGMRLEVIDHKVSNFHLFTPARSLKRFFESTCIGENIESVIPLWKGMDINLKEAER